MAKKPAKKSRKRTTSKARKTKPTPSSDGRLWFDEQGCLNQSGPVPLSRYLDELSDQLRLFLARLGSCERTDAGDYRLRDARVGNLGGMRVLWENVLLLAGAIIAAITPGIKPDQLAAYKRGGRSVVVPTAGPARNAQPLIDALLQLEFSTLYNKDGSWVSEIPSAAAAKIRTIADELPLHQTAWERSEGGTTRTPALSSNPLQRLKMVPAILPTARGGNRAGAEAMSNWAGADMESTRSHSGATHMGPATSGAEYPPSVMRFLEYLQREGRVLICEMPDEWCDPDVWTYGGTQGWIAFERRPYSIEPDYAVVRFLVEEGTYPAGDQFEMPSGEARRHVASGKAEWVKEPRPPVARLKVHDRWERSDCVFHKPRGYMPAAEFIPKARDPANEENQRPKEARPHLVLTNPGIAALAAWRMTRDASDRMNASKGGAPRIRWMTVRGAGSLLRIHLKDEPLKRLEARVSAAATRGEIDSNGKVGLDRRLDARSVRQWVQTQVGKAVVRGKVNTVPSASQPRSAR